MASSASSDSSLQAFKQAVSPLVGIDLAAYKDRQMERRILAMMHRAGLSDPQTYLDVLRSDPAKLRDFELGLTIHVSEWFRNRDRFDDLQHEVFPELLDSFGRIRIWSAGCSIGSELYSTMLLADRLGILSRCEFVGTDIDSRVLDQAAEGVFLPHEQKGLSTGDIATYFDPLPGGGLRLKASLARRARFFRHNLLADPPPGGFSLVLCRNVVIYFTEASKAKLYRDLATALDPGGVLFVGSTERIANPRDLGFESLRPYFYRCMKGTTHDHGR